MKIEDNFYIRNMYDTLNNTIATPAYGVAFKDSEQKEPSDKVMVDILNYIVQGEEDKAVELANSYFGYANNNFSRYYVTLLADVVKTLKTYNINKSENYYDYSKKSTIDIDKAENPNIEIFVRDLVKELEKI